MTDDPIRLCRVLGSTMCGDRANKMSAIVRTYETLRHIDRIDYWHLSDGGMSVFSQHLEPLIEQCKHEAQYLTSDMPWEIELRVMPGKTEVWLIKDKEDTSFRTNDGGPRMLGVL